MRLAMSNVVMKTFHLGTPSNSLSYCSNKFRGFSKLFERNLKTLVPDRFTLEKGEAFRVPSGCRELHVLSGVAWITIAGEDIIVKSGEKTSLVSEREFAVLSPLGNVPLVLEIL